MSNTNPKAAVLIVEDNPIIAYDLKDCLQDSGYKIAGVAHNANAAYDLLKGGQIEIAILDIHLGTGDSGIDIASHIQSEHKIPFVFLTSFSDQKTLEEAREQGPFGYLVKPFQEATLLTTIQVALDIFNSKQEQVSFDAIKRELTKQEKKICRALCKGNTYQEIADENFVSINTVRFHLKNVFVKAEVQSRSELIAKLLGAKS